MLFWDFLRVFRGFESFRVFTRVFEGLRWVFGGFNVGFKKIFFLVGDPFLKWFSGSPPDQHLPDPVSLQV